MNLWSIEHFLNIFVINFGSHTLTISRKRTKVHCLFFSNPGYSHFHLRAAMVDFWQARFFSMTSGAFISSTFSISQNPAKDQALAALPPVAALPSWFLIIVWSLKTVLFENQKNLKSWWWESSAYFVNRNHYIKENKCKIPNFLELKIIISFYL